MSQFSKEYAQFFTSPAGIYLLTWLQERRLAEHERAEENPEKAPQHAMKAATYRELIEHIDSVQTGLGRSSITGDTTSASSVMG